jgi:hypothetical protein
MTLAARLPPAIKNYWRKLGQNIGASSWPQMARLSDAEFSVPKWY